jgi:1,4-alpha-glucan branching enzyme
MIYAYSEEFLLPFSHKEVSGGRPGLIGQMPGEMNDWLANLRLTYAYQMMHPGKKLLFMGQDWADPAGLDVNRAIDWTLQETDRHHKVKCLVQALNGLYRTHPALFALDDHPDGFEWINCIAADNCMLSFIRRSKKDEEMLVIVANFANIRQEFIIGVPQEGRYNEIFNTDAKEFGGGGRVNAGEKMTEEVEADELPYSFAMSSAPLSLSVFDFTPLSPAEQAERNKKKAEMINARLKQEKEEANMRRAAEKEAAEQRAAADKAAAEQRAAAEKAAAEQQAAADKAAAEQHAAAAKIAAEQRAAAEKAAAEAREAAEKAAAEERAKAEKEAAERRAQEELERAEQKAAAELKRLKVK